MKNLPPFVSQRTSVFYLSVLFRDVDCGKEGHWLRMWGWGEGHSQWFSGQDLELSVPFLSFSTWSGNEYPTNCTAWRKIKIKQERNRNWPVSELIMDLKFSNCAVISNSLGSLFWVCISEAELKHHGIKSQSRNQGSKLR